MIGEVRDGFTLREEYWLNERLHRVWFNAETGQIRHERWDPPGHIAARVKMLNALRDSRKERARKADGLGAVIASFSASERDRLHQLGVKDGDMAGLDWALKQPDFEHCRVMGGKLDRG